MKRAPLESAENSAREIARTIKEACPPGWGFVLVLASYGEGGLSTYLSSVQRADAMKLLREMADRIESQEKSL